MQGGLLIKFMTIVMAVFVWGSAEAGQTEFPSPKAEFSADMTMSIKQAGAGQPYMIYGKVYATKTKERREVSHYGRKTAIIENHVTNERWTLMLDQKRYMTQQGPGDYKNPRQMMDDGEVRMTPEGSETINGRRGHKYRIESVGKAEGKFSGYAWFTKENIPIRFVGTTVENGIRNDIQIDYANIVVARQSPQLFTLPADFKPISTSMGGSAIPMQNMTPEQRQQLMEILKNKGVAPK